jgi:PAS domain S-box-containing protein
MTVWLSSPKSRKAAFVIVLCLLAGTVSASYVWAHRYSDREKWVEHTYEVLSDLSSVSAGLSAAENARRGYVLSADRTMLLDFNTHVQSIQKSLNSLESLIADNAKQRQDLAQLKPLIDSRIQVIRQSIALQDNDPRASEQQADLTRQGAAIDDKIQFLLSKMQDEENLLLRERTNASLRTQRHFSEILVFTFLLAAVILIALLLLMSSEVARRTQAEAVAIENEERFRLLVSGVQDYAIIRLDLEGRITTWNRGAERMFGYHSAEILGQPLVHLFQACDNATPARHLETALRDGHIEDDCQQLRNDGTVFWARADLTLLRDAEGQPRGYALITRDITERRRQQEEISQREAQLDAFFSNAPVGLAIIDKDFRFQRINGPFSKINGLAPEENQGQYVRDVTSELAVELEPLIRQVATTGVPIVNHEITGRAPASPETTGWWLKSFFPISRNDGGVTQIGAMVQDITALKRAENTVRWLSGRLLQLRDSERRRLARDLHDSLGQILSAVKMNLSYLGRETVNLDERGRNAVTESRELIDSCIKEVRTLSHLLHPPMLDEVGLLPAIRWFVNGFSQRSGVEVKLDLPTTLRRLPNELEIAIFRSLQESLTNVHRHSGSSTALVSLTVQDSQIHLEVTDTGCGIPPQKLTARRESATLGIGILGMRERMRQLGGQLEISSAKPGTTVHVILPLGELA